MSKHIKNDDVASKFGLTLKEKIIPSLVVVFGIALLVFLNVMRTDIVISSLSGLIAYETVELFTLAHMYRKQKNLLEEQAQSILNELWYKKVGMLLISFIMLGLVFLFSNYIS